MSWTWAPRSAGTLRKRWGLGCERAAKFLLDTFEDPAPHAPLRGCSRHGVQRQGLRPCSRVRGGFQLQVTHEEAMAAPPPGDLLPEAPPWRGEHLRSLTPPAGRATQFLEQVRGAQSHPDVSDPWIILPNAALPGRRNVFLKVKPTGMRRSSPSR